MRELSEGLREVEYSDTIESTVEINQYYINVCVCGMTGINKWERIGYGIHLDKPLIQKRSQV